MPEASLETLVPEQDFARIVGEQARALLHLGAAPDEAPWTKRRFFEVSTEAHDLESLLDDYGARRNRTFTRLTELVASIRGFSLAGLSLEHLARRMAGYGTLDRLEGRDRRRALEDIEAARSFVQDRLSALLRALLEEARTLGVTSVSAGDGAAPADREVRRYRLPNNLDQESVEDEEKRIAEVATKFLQAADMLEGLDIRQLDDADEREAFLRARCREEHARVYEATVHNLQSAYDTYVGHTLLEARDERLSQLRGHVSAALHVLEAVTQLTHFVERHERGLRTDLADELLQRVVPRAQVREVTLNRLLYWARHFVSSGRELAEGLLPSYTNVRSLEVELADGLSLHARPASLIVAVVNHHGTPVELDVGGTTCNAGSILELMVAIGSNPEQRVFVFRGDERPLEDLRALFEGGLGEDGVEHLSERLAYLKGQ